MTKSVKELIYDYLNNGQEAAIANKMHCFEKVQGMFSRIARDRDYALLRNKFGPSGDRVMSPMDWLAQKLADPNPINELEPIPLGDVGRDGARYFPGLKGVVLRRPPQELLDGMTSELGVAGGNIAQMMGRRRRLKQIEHHVYFPIGGEVTVRDGILIETLYPLCEPRTRLDLEKLKDIDISECYPKSDYMEMMSELLSSKKGMFRRQLPRLRLKPEFVFGTSLKSTLGQSDRNMPIDSVSMRMSPSAIQRRFDDERFEGIREAFRSLIYGQMVDMLHKSRYQSALGQYYKEQTDGRELVTLDLPKVDRSAVEGMARYMLARIKAMHPELPSLDYPSQQSVIYGMAADYDGDDYPYLEEKKMKYIVKLLTTDLFHNEVVLVNSLISKLNDTRPFAFGVQYVAEFEEVLASMAALGQSSVTLENHELTTQLVDSILPGATMRLVLTAPTEDNPAVIANFYVAPERDLLMVPAFAVSITPATEENKDEMKELEEAIASYYELTRDVVAGYLAGHLDVRSSRILKDLVIEPYNPANEARNSQRGLTLSEVMLTAGKNVEWLLGTSEKLRDYVEALKTSGVAVDVEVEKLPQRSAYWSAPARGPSGWVVVPVETKSSSEPRPMMVYASEDDLINYQAPRHYREAEVVVNRKKAISIADGFFGPKDAE